MDKKVTVLVFSPRNKGNCAKIGEVIADFHKRTNVHMFCIDANSFPPCHGCDYECLKPGESCPVLTQEQRAVMDAVCESDLTYFVVPNYCGYPSAAYFAFNERSVGYFGLNRELMNRYMQVPKRFIIVSNSESETFHNAMRQQTNEEPEILYLKTSAYGKKSIAGDLMSSEDAKADLERFLANTL